MRVLALDPAAIDLVFAVGGEDLLVNTAGRSLDADFVRSLRPDVIVGHEPHALDTAAPETLLLDPVCIEDVFDDLLRVGAAIGREQQAHEAMIALRERYWTAVDFVTPFAHRPEVAFLEGIDPLVSGGRWRPQLVEAAGGRHGLNPPGATARAITPADLIASAPDRLIVCPRGLDPDPTARVLTDLAGAAWWKDLPAVREGRVAVLDGSRSFDRPGPALVEAFRWLVGWINDRPELIPPGFPAAPAGTSAGSSRGG